MTQWRRTIFQVHLSVDARGHRDCAAWLYDIPGTHYPFYKVNTTVGINYVASAWVPAISPDNKSSRHLASTPLR